MKYFFSLIGMVLLILLTACTGKETSQEIREENKLQIVTTYSIIYDVVKNVVGDNAEIYSIVPIGADPHEFDPLPEDLKRTTDADVVFYHGLNLEEGNGWFNKLIETSGKSKDVVFSVSEGVEPIYLESAGLTNEPDPHTWLDVNNVILFTENVRDNLIEIDVENQEVYKENAENYIKQLEGLHTKILETIDQIPEENRYLITSEGAFKYFEKAYGIKTGYIWEINSENEGSPQQIRDVVDLIRENNILALFVETSIDPRSMETVSKETGVPIAGEVYTDSLGKEGTDGDTYIKMMESNLNVLYQGLVNGN
ncbi:MAG: metal ABC transporter substrate-binding protein [Bacillaceae bacterium]|nr:metal ABC transporter substrate-binding protein [Bacillaceae bacterium]